MKEGTKDKVGWTLGVIAVIVLAVVVIVVGVNYGVACMWLTVCFIPLAILLLYIFVSTVLMIIEILHGMFMDMF